LIVGAVRIRAPPCATEHVHRSSRLQTVSRKKI
jgi:hypothetical protein